MGAFERSALELALDGATTQEKRGGKLLTVVPLPFAVAGCAICHTNYADDFTVGQIVGAISLQVPLLDLDPPPLAAELSVTPLSQRRLDRIGAARDVGVVR